MIGDRRKKIERQSSEVAVNCSVCVYVEGELNRSVEVDYAAMHGHTGNRRRDDIVLECVGMFDISSGIASPEYSYVDFVPPVHSHDLYFMMSPIIKCCEYFEVGDVH